ncbi:DNA repair protein RecO [Candidatus Izimaplasma bacterium HR1]|jgi:DNA repair protein RecO (recombination protein O)|uniref:DNA repair protein RecO n=1 Tax=Candidatus Izimoplasma sp. HR1 TaxID=1541959 RepID=UPI0004F8D29B|nr:DNA repair protein RecO [Candidatus Izimaplasma bacterium HR1]
MNIDKAFVLNSLDYKDNSKILYLYTVNGHLSVLAHGVKKLNSINRFLSQNGNLISLSISKGKFPSLKEGHLVNDYESIKKDIYKYTYMNHIMELVRSVISDDLNHEKMFSFLEKLFIKMDEGTDPDILSFIFELKLLYFVGYGLNFKKCNVCNDNENLVFNPSSGGLTCSKHLNFKDPSYDRDIYLILQDLYMIDISVTDIPKLDTPLKAVIRNIIDMLYNEFISFKTKSREIIKQIEKY